MGLSVQYSPVSIVCILRVGGRGGGGGLENIGYDTLTNSVQLSCLVRTSRNMCHGIHSSLFFDNMVGQPPYSWIGCGMPLKVTTHVFPLLIEF